MVMESQVAGGVQGPSTRRVASSDERLEAAASIRAASWGPIGGTIPRLDEEMEKRLVAVDCCWKNGDSRTAGQGSITDLKARVYGRND